MADGELRFIQIAVEDEALYGLTKDGQLWSYDRAASLWKRHNMKFEMTGRPVARPGRRR